MSVFPLKIVEKQDSGQDTSSIPAPQKLTAAEINIMVNALKELKEAQGAGVIAYDKRLTIKINNDGQERTNVGDCELGVFIFTNGVKRIGLMQLKNTNDRAVEATWENLVTTILN